MIFDAVGMALGLFAFFPMVCLHDQAMALPGACTLLLVATCSFGLRETSRLFRGDWGPGATLGEVASLNLRPAC